MSDLEPTSQTGIRVSESGGLTLVEHPRAIHFYRITEDELEHISSVGLALSLWQAGTLACLSLCITLWSLWLSVDTLSLVAGTAIFTLAIVFSILLLAGALGTGWAIRGKRHTLSVIKSRDTPGIG